MKRQDLLDACKGHPKAEEAVFWFCYSWQSGRNSDLYRALCESPYWPPFQRQFSDDPDIISLFASLEEKFGPMDKEPPWEPIRFSDLQEGDIVVAGSKLSCLPNRWPCKVFRHGGQLAVMCNDGRHEGGSGIHTLHADPEGYLRGFRR